MRCIVKVWRPYPAHPGCGGRSRLAMMRNLVETNNVIRAKLLLALCSAFMLAAETSAQYPGGTGGTGGSGGRGGMGGPGSAKSGPPQDGMRRGPPADAPLSPGAMVQVQLDQLEDDLRMTPAQLGAWRVYADKVQKLADDTARSRFDARAATPAPRMPCSTWSRSPAPRAAGRPPSTRSSQAGRAFYATLNDDQRGHRRSPPLALRVAARHRRDASRNERRGRPWGRRPAQ